MTKLSQALSLYSLPVLLASFFIILLQYSTLAHLSYYPYSSILISICQYLFRGCDGT